VLVVAIAVWVDERNHLSLRESSWRNILLPIFCFGAFYTSTFFKTIFLEVQSMKITISISCTFFIYVLLATLLAVVLVVVIAVWVDERN
jgi:hypothetical protein